MAPTPGTSRESRVPIKCLAVWLAVSVVLAITPRDRGAWFLETLPVVPAAALALWVHRQRYLDDRSWMMVTAFMLLHAYGSHYTYAQTPVGNWARAELGLSRNHYARVVHFAFGVLMFRGARRVTFPESSRLSASRERALTLAVMAAAALGYELLEWIVAIIVAPERGAAFLATQGDEWDAQKDTGLALLGAGLAAAVDRRPPRNEEV